MKQIAVFLEKDMFHIVNKLNNFYEKKIVDLWKNKTVKNINLYFDKYNIERYEVNKDSYMGLLLDCETNRRSYYIKIVPTMLDRYKHEIGTLKRLSRSCVCKFYEFNDDNEMFIMEKILPGNKVTFVENQEQISALFDRLFIDKIEVTNSLKDSFRNFFDVVNYDYCIYKRINKKYEFDSIFVEKLYNKFLLLYKELQNNNNEYLLHGDIYENNMLNSDNGIKVIDPLGFIAPYIIEYTPICAYELLNHSNDYKKTYNEFVDFFGDRIKESDYNKALFCQLVKVFIPSIYEANDGGERARKWLDIIKVLYGLE